MQYGLANYVKAITQDRFRTRGRFQTGSTAAQLELTVERAMQGARRCRQCASIHGRYVCIASRAVRNEWRHSDSGVELFVHLLACQPDGGPRLQATILVKAENRSHARAVYVCELSSADLNDGPWTLSLISEKSECDFVFPGQVDVVASGMLAGTRESTEFSGR